MELTSSFIEASKEQQKTIFALSEKVNELEKMINLNNNRVAMADIY